LSLGCSRGPGFIAVALPDGRRRLIRRAATDLDWPLASAVMLPRISLRTLLPLARLIRSMVAASCKEACHADTLPSSAAPTTATAGAPLPPTVMADAAGTDAHAAGPAPRPSSGTRSGRGGTSC
jgi:hypothetical protein